jgi:hypothetical protein
LTQDAVRSDTGGKDMKKNIFDQSLKKYGGRYEIRNSTYDYLLKSLKVDSEELIRELILEDDNLPEVYIDYIDSDGLNACAFKVDNDFYIGIMKGTVAKIKQLVDQLLDDVMDSKFHNLNYRKCDEYKIVFLVATIRFIILHEYGHIVNGHSDWKKNRMNDNFFFEKYTDGCILSNLDNQTREMNADRYAVKVSIDNIFKNNGFLTTVGNRVRIDSITETLVCLYCATYIMFLAFSSPNYDVKDFYKLSHPHPGIRQCYTINTTMNEYVFDVHEFDMDLNTYVNVVQGDYERIAFNIAQLRNEKLNPITVAYTKLGWEHMLKIHNNWENVRNQLLDYSYTELEPFERMDYYISSLK